VLLLLVALLLLLAGCGSGVSHPGLSEIDALAVDPLHPQIVYATALDAPVYKSADGGASWKRLGPSRGGGVFGGFVLDPGRPTTAYAGTYSGVFKSTDGGASWMRAGLKDQTVRALAIAPGGRVLYAGLTWIYEYFPDRPSVFRSTDGGASWIPAGLDGLDVVALALNPRRPTTIYAATEGATLGPSFKSTDGGASWQRLSGLTSGVLTLAVDPHHPQVVYAGTGSGVFRSADGGVLWRYVGLKDVPHQDTRFIPGVQDFAFGPKTVYAATNGGVYRSTNAGSDWHLVDLGNNDVLTVAITPSGRVLYAGTDGGDIYRFRLGG
jgi:photosystem II stability/assembly factor-like uncharacterized protein